MPLYLRYLISNKSEIETDSLDTFKDHFKAVSYKLNKFKDSSTLSQIDDYLYTGSCTSDFPTELTKYLDTFRNSFELKQYVSREVAEIAFQTCYEKFRNQTHPNTPIFCEEYVKDKNIKSDLENNPLKDTLTTEQNGIRVKTVPTVARNWNTLLRKSVEAVYEILLSSGTISEEVLNQWKKNIEELYTFIDKYNKTPSGKVQCNLMLETFSDSLLTIS